MTRRSRFRSSRAGTAQGGFSLADMRDVVTSATDSLVDAIAAQNPNVDADGFETELRELVTRYGRGGNSAPAGFSAIASAAPAETRYEYSLSGDLLVAAHEYFRANDHRAFLQTLRDAFRAEDAPKLFAAIAEMNSMTDVEDQAAADDSDMDILPEDGDEEDLDIESGFADDGDSPDNFEVYSGDDEDEYNDDPLARDEIMADMDNGDHEFRSSANPMPSGDSDEDLAATRRQQIAFLNKATLSGSPEDRKKASEAVRRSRLRG